MKISFRWHVCIAVFFLSFLSSVFAPTTQAQAYTDPQRRFSIQVHADWMAKAFDSGGASGVTLVHGAGAYVQVLLLTGMSPAAFLKSLNDNMSKQLSSYHVNGQGMRTLAGQPSSFISGTGQSSDGIHHTLVYLETFVANGITYSAVSSSSGESLTDQRMLADYNDGQEMIKTLTLGAGAPPLSASASNPAPKASAPPAHAETPVTGTTHNDPAGFSVNVPAGWNVVRDTGTGSITLRGQRGERVVIWPMAIGQQLDARGAADLLRQLARKIDGEMSWSMQTSSSNVVRAIGRTSQRSATALLSWANGANGTTGGTTAYMYYVGAATDSYRASTDTFVGILKSFHIVQDPSLANAQASGGAGGNSALNFVGWNDPHEGAFTTSVPQGWRVIGGAYRLSTTDIRYAITMAAPDGQIRATIGDSNIGLFTQPTQMMGFAGLREGQYQTLGDGSRLEIRRYISGQQFARSYAENTVSRQCSGLQIVSNNARQDLASTFSQEARNEGAGSAQITAGDVSFTCSLNGNTVQGKYVAATAILAPGQSPMWAVYRLYGYLAPAARQQDGERVVTQAVQSWKFNPQWEAQQKGAANAALQQDNQRSQQIQSRARAAIAEDQRETSEIITKGYEDRQKVYDEISRKRENSILGTMDVVDPETGTQYKVSNFGDYHYMTNDGYIISTNSAYSPGPDVRDLITLP